MPFEAGGARFFGDTMDVTDIRICKLPYQEHPFVHGVRDGKDVWLMDNGQWTEEDGHPNASIPVYENVIIMTKPFSRGQKVKSRYSDGRLIREGENYRVIECRQSGDCGSGWMVSVTGCQPGPMPANPAITGEVDSDWFEVV